MSAQVYMGIFSVYLSSFLVNFFVVFYFYNNSRLSIFNGSENIAIGVFYLVALFIFFSNLKSHIKLFAVVLFLVSCYLSESRTSLIVVFISLLIYFFKRIDGKALLKGGGGISVLLFISTFLDFDGRKFSFFNNLYSMIYNEDSVQDMLLLDIRGSLLLDGISIIKDNFLFGLGAVQPEVFKEMYLTNLATFHNALIDSLVMYGFIGTLFLGHIVFLALKKMQFSYNPFLQVTCLTFFMLCFLQPYFFNYQVAGLFMYLCCLHNRNKI
ncbi:hypothetical protein NCCP2140_32000 [Pseudoalteromonas sp. NCCP-2140]|nr:hypothetical protein NCCP2140_32000 [Pseudoalteromonas sp. NCCP-2140]